MGVPGSDVPYGFRSLPQSLVFFVDANHSDASDNADGTNPEQPLATIQAAVDRVQNAFDTILVRSIRTAGESVLVPATANAFCKILGVGPHGVTWTSDGAALPNLDLRARGWEIAGFKIIPPTTESGVILRNADTAAGDIALETHLHDLVLDGSGTGRYGITSYGAVDVVIEKCRFHRFHNAVAGGAIPMRVIAGGAAISARNVIRSNEFMDCDNGALWPGSGNLWYGNHFQPVGVTYSMTQVLNTAMAVLLGDHNLVTGNYLGGDYSIVGGYNGSATDEWAGNFVPDIAEAEVGDNGLTILPPA